MPEDIGGVEKHAGSISRLVGKKAFTAQIIINHVQARDDEKIDNVDQALGPRGGKRGEEPCDSADPSDAWCRV